MECGDERKGTKHVVIITKFGKLSEVCFFDEPPLCFRDHVCGPEQHKYTSAHVLVKAVVDLAAVDISAVNKTFVNYPFTHNDGDQEFHMLRIAYNSELYAALSDIADNQNHSLPDYIAGLSRDSVQHLIWDAYYDL